MSNSLSPGSDLVIDDDDLEITMEDLSRAEAECGASGVGSQVLARPATIPVPKLNTFKFGATSSNIYDVIPLAKHRVSSADPRTKFKPAGFLNLNSECSLPNAFSVTMNNSNRIDDDTSLKRTVNNNTGSSSFSKPQNQDCGNKFVFGSASSSTMTLPVTPTFSPPHSPSTIADADSQGEDLSKYILMKQRHEAKMKAEKLKMDKIEKMIELKKQKQQMQQKFWIDSNPSYDPEIRAKQMELAKQELELKRQTTRMLQMQQAMLMKNNADEERRRLEEKKGMLELQVQVKNLEKMLSNKQEPVGSGTGPFHKKPIKNRLGPIKSRLGSRQQNVRCDGSMRSFAGGRKYDRRRRLGENLSEASRKDNSEGFNSKKQQDYWNVKLPDDLVLTEITDQGPVKKVELNKIDAKYGDLENEEEEGYEEDLDRYECEGDLDPDLVLTEFGENGPVKAAAADSNILIE